MVIYYSSEQLVMSADGRVPSGLWDRFKLHTFDFIQHIMTDPPLTLHMFLPGHVSNNLFCWYRETFSKMLMRSQCSRPASLHYVD